MSTKETTQDVETAPTNTMFKKGFLTPTQLRKYVKDAENIAWEEFFNFIHKYEGDKYSVLQKA